MSLVPLWRSESVTLSSVHNPMKSLKAAMILQSAFRIAPLWHLFMIRVGFSVLSLSSHDLLPLGFVSGYQADDGKSAPLPVLVLRLPNDVKFHTTRYFKLHQDAASSEGRGRGALASRLLPSKKITLSKIRENGPQTILNSLYVWCHGRVTRDTL